VVLRDTLRTGDLPAAEPAGDESTLLARSRPEWPQWRDGRSGREAGEPEV